MLMLLVVGDVLVNLSTNAIAGMVHNYNKQLPELYPPIDRHTLRSLS
ncbi:hypothetical protein [Paenibacillus sp. 1011MAR3C5]|nr:hypothetical protein [Paenibacillus sp. 1011MAR3C5]